MRRKLEEQTSEATVVNTLRTTFEDRFRYDEAGLPRVWKPEDDIEAAFKKAKDEVSIRLYARTNAADSRLSPYCRFSQMSSPLIPLYYPPYPLLNRPTQTHRPTLHPSTPLPHSNYSLLPS
jgi:hypothetical protein